MKIIIDGYNLLHQSSFVDRDHLIRAVSRYQKTCGHELALVFDGTFQGTFSGDRSFYESVQIIYTPITETADDYIGDWVKSLKGQVVLVISSDRKVQGFARAAGLDHLSCDVFLRRLEDAGSFREVEEHDASSMTLRPWEEGREQECNLHSSGKKKGNPRKLSKKDRRRKHLIKKL
ncbi:MAG: NYN domain-containing protein [Bdellovibrionota bacterium]